MRITAVTKFKNGELWACLKKAGWSALELSRRTGYPYQKILRFLNLQSRPSDGELLRVQAAFGEVGLFLDVEKVWPEQEFKGFGRTLTVEQTQEVEEDKLLAYAEQQRLLSEGTDVNLLPEYGETLQEAMGVLTARQRQVIEEFLEDPELDTKKLAKKLGVTRTNISALKLSSIRRLRYQICRLKELAPNKKENGQHKLAMTADQVWKALHAPVSIDRKNPPPV
jgi:transcriptional regulator with XRE-family HTH domain